MQRTSMALPLIAAFVLGCDAGPAPVQPARPGAPSEAKNADQEVLIATVPDGADVMLAGAKVGVTPFRMLVRGNTNVVLEKAGYVRQALLITPESEPNMVVELVADATASADGETEPAAEGAGSKTAVKKVDKEKGKTGGAEGATEPPAGDGATKEPEAPAPESAVSKAKGKVYETMAELKQDLRAGRITEADYRRWQAEIREKRAAELVQLKNDYAAGKLTKAEYAAKAKQIKNKYEGN
jgi:hypothetical protein